MIYAVCSSETSANFYLHLWDNLPYTEIFVKILGSILYYTILYYTILDDL